MSNDPWNDLLETKKPIELFFPRLATVDAVATAARRLGSQA
jgi:hypothetical protein